MFLRSCLPELYTDTLFLWEIFLYAWRNLIDSLLVHTHSTEFSGRVPGLPGVGLKRKDTLDFGLDLFLYGKGDEKVEKAKERFLSYLDSIGYPVEKGFPVPSVVFSCVTFPLRWSAEDKMTAVFYAID